eukprot:3717392-Pyramimonas_sp.AAC.1
MQSSPSTPAALPTLAVVSCRLFCLSSLGVLGPPPAAVPLRLPYPHLDNSRFSDMSSDLVQWQLTLGSAMPVTIDTGYVLVSASANPQPNN